MKDLIHQNWLFIIPGLFLAILGILLQQTRAYSLIARYNTMSRKKRRSVNIEQVAIAIRNCFILLGLIWIIIPILTDLLGLKEILVKVGLVVGAHLLGIISLIISINTKKKYKISNLK